MSVELATAYLSIVPDTSKIAPEIRRSLGDTSITRAADKGGSSFGGRFMSGAGKALKRTAIGVGVAAGGALALSITKGIGRLTAIEDAEAKLTGLGNSAKTVDRIMGSALASVKGTAFGLDEAATTAAGAVAAGVKPGQELEKTLRLVADAATIGGSSLSEMGAIFNKVATSNKVQGEVLNQLGERGIPIVQLLAEQLGVTAGEVSEMSRKGTIDFDTFRKAMESGLGGAALASGDTTSGAFRNMGAAVSRFGATLIQGVFPIAKRVFGGITTLLDNLGERIGPSVERFSARLVPAFDQYVRFLQGMGSAYASFGSVLANRVFPILQSVASALSSNFGPVLSSLATTFTTRILPGLQALGGYISTNVLPIFQQWGGVLANDVIPVVASVAQWIADKLVPAVLDIAQRVATRMKPVFDELVRVIREGVIPFVQGLVQKFNQARPVLQKVAEGVVWVVGKFLDFYTAIQAKVYPVIYRVVGFLLRNLVPALSKVAQFSLNMAAKVIRGFKGVADGVVTSVGVIIDGLAAAANALNLPFAEELNKASAAVDSFQSNTLSKMDGWAAALETAARIAGSGISSGIADGFGRVDLVSTVKKLPKNQQVAAALGVPLPPDITYVMKKTGGGGGGGGGGFDLPSGGGPSGSTAGGGGGGDGGGGSVIDKAADKLKRTRDELRSFIKGSFVKDLVGGTEAQVTRQINQLIEKVEDSFAGKREKRLVARLERQRAILVANARQRVQIAKDLAKAEDIAAKTRDLSNSVKSNALGNLAQLSSPAEVKGFIRQRITEINAFAGNLAKLKARGLPSFFLQQIIDEGLNGAPLAAALAKSSGADFSAIVSGATRLQAAAGNLGNTASTAMFGVGADAAQGLVDGLKAKTKTLEGAMKVLGKKMVAAIRKALRSNSPSKELIDVGEDTGDGAVIGVTNKYAEAEKAMAGLLTPPGASTFDVAAGGRPAGSLDDLAAEVRALAVAVAANQDRPVVLSANKREFARVLDDVNARSDRMVSR